MVSVRKKKVVSCPGDAAAEDATVVVEVADAAATGPATKVCSAEFKGFDSFCGFVTKLEVPVYQYYFGRNFFHICEKTETTWNDESPVLQWWQLPSRKPGKHSSLRFSQCGNFASCYTLVWFPYLNHVFFLVIFVWKNRISNKRHVWYVWWFCTHLRNYRRLMLWPPHQTTHAEGTITFDNIPHPWQCQREHPGDRKMWQVPEPYECRKFQKLEVEVLAQDAAHSTLVTENQKDCFYSRSHESHVSQVAPCLAVTPCCATLLQPPAAVENSSPESAWSPRSRQMVTAPKNM